ncbi:hypothetical protein DI09_221p20 [Mitosporidium daphniae]|uniref:Apurinic-apyrimidinic endonuclease 1 n=1 Tax=Mitosporidium daphniae TaxID=1485682 RepID=A0A098VSS2_9MICR|nr:uncharacterized protein DI09_221p20 [Mitosporidium daphniae]KGG52025.1 hypothetical protein DI09_221p20 [Mitosporidium daphniae]|eukprot:XP_013238461.1 uncharacterized protein DI09_221p20 [Mitosporidium daphniae]
MKRKGSSSSSLLSPSSKKNKDIGSFFKQDPAANKFIMPKFDKTMTRKAARATNKWVGAHLGISGGIHKSITSSCCIEANAVALFVRSQRRWTSPALAPEAISEFGKVLNETSFMIPDEDKPQILPHGSYLINLGNPDPKKRKASYLGFLDELKRCEALNIKLYNFHPGSTCGECSKSESIEFIAESINMAHKETSFVKILLENMAGQGNVIGSAFEELAAIIERVVQKDRIGVCLDTCHAFSAGYDIRTPEGWEIVLEKFDRLIGINPFLSALHLNDSKGPLGCKKDRHENIGMGHIGIECFKFIMRDPRFDKIPLILETPLKDEDNGTYKTYADEIQLLYSFTDSNT